MPKAIMKCRVCGKDYEGCRTTRLVPGVFRWQEVACSPECGAKYLRQINESRGLISPSPQGESPKFVSAPPVIESGGDNSAVSSSDVLFISTSVVGEELL